MYGKLESTNGPRNISDTSTEMHKLCWADDWEAARYRGGDHRGEIAMPDANGILPLHIAVWHKAPRSFIEFLVAAHPEGTGAKTNSGYYPLDYAKLFYKEDETLEVLLEVKEAEEEKVKNVEVEGSQTQLHKLCFWKFDEATSRVSHAPEEVSYQDADGNLPLHIALEHKAPLSLINALLSSHPAGAWHANVKGRLPLHTAAEHWVKLNVMRAVKEAYPAAVNRADMAGDLPISFAMKTHDQNVLLLLEPKDGVTPGKQKWGKHWDEGSGCHYYLNNFTQESSWEKPEDFHEKEFFK
ncbi:hypothetical protein TrRE_jg2187 [Triparma retinervis]|uniref:WW domain-containing protein n=1 Tax=Triparma retinervis TaxID=2557542 RepID=A0A9W7CB42_9STRA|nr:hypothetical protein TrRE_jg2187 [Triparma retinervis]